MLEQLNVPILGWCCYFTLLAAAAAASGYTTHPSEVSGLLAVKASLVDHMKNLSNWKKGDDPCTSNWTGVLCFDKIQNDGYLHIRELQLLNMNLSGNLAPEIGQLSQLNILDFMWNELTGSIPKEIGNISPLKLLLLNGNRLSGSLPDELGNLSNLTRLQVDLNHISGQIPKSFANLSSVKHLHLNNNSLSGEIPSELSQLPNLLHLLLDTNNLTGKIPPEFASLPELRILQLDNNNFQGFEIPASYGSLSKLVKLSLRNCSLHGTIPDFGSIQTLHYLDLSWNNLTGPLPPRLSDNTTTIDLSDNHLNGTIPENFSSLPNLQRLSLENNLLTGPVPNDIWRNISFNSSGRLTVDLRNNMLSNITGNLNPPANVTLRLGGNPICSDSKLPNISQFCGSNSGNEIDESSANYTNSCPAQECPTDQFYEYVPEPPVQCYCAAPLRIGYRLKSPSFSYFPPFISQFESYVTSCLKLERYQLFIDSYAWEAGPRLRMYLKLFPAWDYAHSHEFNQTQVQSLRDTFASWNFSGSDFFGPYELLNFTLLGPYSKMNLENPGKNISMGELAAIVVGVIIFAAAVSAIVTLLMTRRQATERLSQTHRPSRVSMQLDGVKSFTFEEMALATDHFNSSTQVGRGGYGRVYQGILTDKTVVAIKRAEAGSLQGQKEFLTEIKLLSRLHHRNLVSLVGYCDEEGEQMLVYEFMPNGTLRDWLSGRAKESLDFRMRLSIAMDSAKGILYLHTEANPPVFHRDVKASNILLDSKFTAKVADFGISRLAPVLDDDGNLPNYVSTVVRGTPGYVDPEYFLTHMLTDKSDVYSLGIVFLELLTGLQPITRGKNIVREVNVAYESGSIFSIIDSRMGSYPSECVEKFAGLAISCCRDNPERRPSMASVVRELENIVKMMPEATFLEAMSLESKTSSDGNPFTSSFPSTSYHSSREVYGSSSGIISGSDLSSGVVPTIAPR